MHKQAEQYHCRPSQLVGVTDEYVAYCVDEAAFLWGMTVESHLLQLVEGEDSKDQRRMMRQREMQRLMKLDLLTPLQPSTEEPVRGQFADPAGAMMRRRRA